MAAKYYLFTEQEMLGYIQSMQGGKTDNFYNAMIAFSLFKLQESLLLTVKFSHLKG